MSIFSADSVWLSSLHGCHTLQWQRFFRARLAVTINAVGRLCLLSDRRLADQMWKCAVAQIQEGELSNGGIISLSDSRKIKPASETDPYKYLGVLQVFDADQELPDKR